jgi:hypothetical protein
MQVSQPHEEAFFCRSGGFSGLVIFLFFSARGNTAFHISEGSERAKTGDRLQLIEIDCGTAFRKREIAASHNHRKTIQRRR